jgi:hypothetical protein
VGQFFRAFILPPNPFDPFFAPPVILRRTLYTGLFPFEWFEAATLEKISAEELNGFLEGRNLIVSRSDWYRERRVRKELEENRTTGPGNATSTDWHGLHDEFRKLVDEEAEAFWTSRGEVWLKSVA